MWRWSRDQVEMKWGEGGRVRTVGEVCEEERKYEWMKMKGRQCEDERKWMGIPQRFENMSERANENECRWTVYSCCDETAVDVRKHRESGKQNTTRS